MNTIQNIHSHPMMEYISSNDLTIKIFITEAPQTCALCEHKTESLYIYSFNVLLCNSCFDFAMSNYSKTVNNDTVLTFYHNKELN